MNTNPCMPLTNKKDGMCGIRQRGPNKDIDFSSLHYHHLFGVAFDSPHFLLPFILAASLLFAQATVASKPFASASTNCMHASFSLNSSAVFAISQPIRRLQSQQQCFFYVLVNYAVRSIIRLHRTLNYTLDPHMRTCR